MHPHVERETNALMYFIHVGEKNTEYEVPGTAAVRMIREVNISLFFFGPPLISKFSPFVGRLLARQYPWTAFCPNFGDVMIFKTREIVANTFNISITFGMLQMNVCRRLGGKNVMASVKSK